MEFKDLQYIKNQALTKGDVVDLLLYDMIGRDPFLGKGINSALFIEELFFISEMQPKAINVRINSPGGNLMEGMNIFNAIERVKEKGIEVNTYIDGMAASIAAPIALNGNTVYMADHALVMIHLPFNPNTEDEGETNKATEAFTNSLATILSAKTNKSKDEVIKLMEETTFFDSVEAVKAGIVEAKNVITTEKNTPDKIENYEPVELYNFYNNLLKQTPKKMDKELLNILGLENNASTEVVTKAVSSLKNNATNIAEALGLEAGAKGAEIVEAINVLKNESEAAKAASVEEFVNSAITSGKFGEDARESLTGLANNDLDLAKKLVENTNKTNSPEDLTNLIEDNVENTDLSKKVNGRSFRELEKNDPELLTKVYNSDLELYKTMYKSQYGTEYAE